MKYPSVAIIYDRKKKASAATGGIIEIRVTFDRQQKYYSTGVKVIPSQWDAQNLKIINNPDSILLNSKISALHSSIKNFITHLSLKDEAFSFVTLSGAIDKSKLNGSFHQFLENSINSRTDITQSTKKNHEKLLHLLEEIGMFEKFGDLTTANIHLFDSKLHERKLRQSTVYTYHKFLKIYTKAALQRNLIEVNPYQGISIDRGKSSLRKYLTEEELKNLIDAEILSPSLDKVRDLFLFQCYTGLAYAELERFSPESIIERNGQKIYTGNRQKTGASFYIALRKPALKILKKYDNRLPVITNQKYNLYLKTLASIANIRKDLTSHMGRHTFAVTALNAGISMEVVSRILGHTNTNTTQIYAKVLDKTVEEAFRLLDK